MATDSYTISLLHMNGTDASTTFTDESGKVWSSNGGAQIDTAQSKFGGAAGLFDGVNEFLDTADSLDWQLDAGSDANSWTVDFWVRFNGDPGTGTMGFIQQRTDNDNYWSLLLTNNTLAFQVRDSASTTVNISNAWNPATATWYHVACVKNGATGYMMFIDGTQIGTTQTDTNTLPNLTGGTYIARHISGAGVTSYFAGWLDEFRVSKGTARWTSNFTPPTQEYVDNTSGFLLLLLS